jgi:hypothetical protein
MLSLKKTLAIGILAASAALCPAIASAQVPQTLVHQGRLFDAAGGPLTGRQSITYRIYDASSGGMLLWSETHMVTLDEGFFSVQLGSMTPFGASVFTGASRFLAVAVGSDPEMTPREPVGSVPYALLAGNVTGDITPRSITVNGTMVIDAMGRWVGPGGTPGAMSGDPDACVNGTRMEGVCVTFTDNSAPGTDWNTAATTCAGLNSDLCSPTQYMRIRYAHEGVGADMFYNDAVNRRAVWSRNFSDNDGGRLGFALQSSDDPSIEQRYGFACCAGAAPAPVLMGATLVRAMGSSDRGVRVTYLNNREETTAMAASRICSQLHSDLCTKSQYVTLNDAGRFSGDIRRLSNEMSDNDGSRFSPIVGSRTADNAAWNNPWAFACCVSQRPTDYTCPGGTIVNGVCVVATNTVEDSSFVDAARACARLNADLCSNSQMQSIRNAGRFPGVRAWTSNGADNDSNRVGGLLSSMPDDPNPLTDRFGYACCL